jgi:uncharacterized protein YfdQ (DUF2303 family)
MEPSNLLAAIDAGKNLTQVHRIDGFRAVVTAPFIKDGVAQLLPERLATPRFLTAKPTFNEAAAFIAYLNLWKNGATRIFYRADGMFVAVIDYHDHAAPQSLTERGARHGDHIAVLWLQRSPEWKTWAGKSEVSMGQQDFAEFIEDNLRDLLQPSAEEMLAIATGLHATASATFRSGINQANGTAQLQWDEQVEGTVRGTGQAIPTAFSVGLRPFMGCSRYPIDCRLRYRVQSGRLALHYKALHLDPITEAALEAIVAGIADQTGIRPALGEHDAVAFKRGE